MPKDVLMDDKDSNAELTNVKAKLGETPQTSFIEREEDVVPDGGWGWFVVLGSFLCHFIIGGLERSAGLLYLHFLERYKQSSAATAWATTIASATRLMLGPLCSFLCNKFSCRRVVLFGSLILTATLVSTAYAPNLETVFVTFGILGGFGRSLTYAPAVMIVGIYFHKRRGLAVGLATSGIGFGSFAAPAIVESAFRFYGYGGGFYILACFAINLCVCGMLYRPLKKQLSLMAFDKRQEMRQNTKNASEVEASVNQSTPLVSHESLNRLPTEYCSSLEASDQRNENNEGCKLMTRESESLNLTEKKIPMHSSSEECLSLQNGPTNNGKIIKNEHSCWSIFRSKSKPKPKEARKPLIEISMLKDYRFLTFCVAILLYTLAFQSAFVFLPAYGKQLGTSDMEAAYLVIISGAFDGVGRVVSGIVLDLKGIKQYRVYVYNTIMFLVGSVSFIIPSTRSYGELCAVCGVYGLLIGAYISQKSVILVDLLGAEKLINSFGLLICFQGVGMLVGPPFSGFLKDTGGRYENAFYVGGSSMLLGALILLISNIKHIMSKKIVK